MVELRDVYMVDYCRTPFSRSRPRQPERDAYSEIRADKLAGLTLRAMFEERALSEKLKPEDVDELHVGCSLQVDDNYLYAGKLVAFLGNFPAEVPSAGFDRQCGSGMVGMHHGLLAIMSGYSDVTVATGMEHMTRVSMDPQINKHFNPTMDLAIKRKDNMWYRDDIDIMTGFSMIQTAQKLFEEECDWATKEMMDKWAVRAHETAQKAYEEGWFKDELVPVQAHKEGAVDEPMLVDKDLAIRPNANYEGTAKLPPVSQPGYRGGYKNPRFKSREYKEKFGTRKGLITAGNSSPLNAGAATCVLACKDALDKYGLEPMVRVVSMGWGSVDPSVMGRGPVPASRMALKHAGLKAEDIGYWEINEAFAIVALNCIHQLGIDKDRVNVKGGSIAIGHPLAATGIRMAGSVARTILDKKAKYGLGNLCCGSGQGTAVIVENLDA